MKNNSLKNSNGIFCVPKNSKNFSSTMQKSNAKNSIIKTISNNKIIKNKNQ